MATTIGTIQLVASIDTSSYKRGANEIEKANSDIENSAGSTSKKANSFFNSVAKVGLAAIAAAAVAVGALIIKNVGGAVKRIDTLVAFPRVLQAMGATAEDAAKSTKTLSDRLDGLPTTLQDGAAGVQALVSAGLKVDDATKTFLAFNNATLAASTEAGAAQGAFTQLVQSISKGKIDGQEWNSMLSAMPTAFQALSKESGKTREQLRELYRTNPEKLLKDLQKLDKDGGGGLASLEDQARTATGGIGTAFTLLQSRIAKSLVDIVKRLGDGDLEAGQRKISNAIMTLSNAFTVALDKVGSFIKYMVDNKDVFAPILVTLGTFVAIITTMAVVIKLVTIAQAIWNSVLLANPIVLIIVAVAALVAGLIYFFTKTELGSKIITTAWAAIKAAFMAVFNWVKTNWPLILGILTGPIGLAVVLITKNWQKITAGGRAAWNGIKSAFSAVGSFFSGVVNRIVGAFKGIGGRIRGLFGNIWHGVGSSLKAIINSILHLPLRLPTIKVAGKTLAGGQMLIPALAEGGIVKSATLAMLGEGREPEVVAPLSKLDTMLKGSGSDSSKESAVINQYNTVNNNVDMNLVNRQLAWELNRA